MVEWRTVWAKDAHLMHAKQRTTRSPGTQGPAVAPTMELEDQQTRGGLGPRERECFSLTSISGQLNRRQLDLVMCLWRHFTSYPRGFMSDQTRLVSNRYETSEEEDAMIRRKPRGKFAYRYYGSGRSLNWCNTVWFWYWGFNQNPAYHYQSSGTSHSQSGVEAADGISASTRLDRNILESRYKEDEL